MATNKDITLHRAAAAPATNQPKTSRRQAVAAALGAVALAGIAAAGMAHPEQGRGDDTDGPDAALLAICAEYVDLDRQIIASFKGDPEGEINPPLRDRLDVRLSEVVEQIADLRATTIEGHQAKGRIVARHFISAGLDKEENGDRHDRMVWLLARDLVPADVCHAIRREHAMEAA